jgi:transcriptional regulator with XRE-family HTH domain
MKTTEDTTQRLRLLRETLGFPTAEAFADHLGISRQRLLNIELGAPLSVDVALRIVGGAAAGVTLDWLYLGIGSAMPIDLCVRLFERLRSMSPERPAQWQAPHEEKMRELADRYGLPLDWLTTGAPPT